MKIYKFIALMLTFTFVTQPGWARDMLRPIAAGENRERLRRKGYFEDPVMRAEKGRAARGKTVDEEGKLRLSTSDFYTVITIGRPFAGLRVLPFEGESWDRGYRICYENAELLNEDFSRPGNRRNLTSAAYRYLVRHYGRRLDEYLSPVFKEADTRLKALRDNVSLPQKKFIKQAEELREVIRCEDSPVRAIFREIKELDEIYSGNLQPLLKTLERLFLEDSPYSTLWQSTLEMGKDPDMAVGYRDFLIKIASAALKELKDATHCLSCFESPVLTASGIIDLRPLAGLPAAGESDGIKIAACPVLGAPFEIWTYNGFSAFNIPFGHNYQYSLFSLLRLFYGFRFDEFRIDYHEDDITAQIISPDRPNFRDKSLRTQQLIRKRAEEMDVQQWHYYLIDDRTTLRTILLTLNEGTMSGFLYQRWGLPKGRWIGDERKHWSLELEPADIPKLKDKNAKRILVIEDDFMLECNPLNVEGEIRRRAEQLKGQGLRFDGIVFVQTSVLQHWMHKFSGRISELYLMRRMVSRIWLRELSRVYGDDAGCQDLINLVTGTEGGSEIKPRPLPVPQANVAISSVLRSRAAGERGKIIAAPIIADRVGEIEAQIMGDLPGADAFRRKTFDLYDMYRFPDPAERSPTRLRHIECVTENALQIGRAYGLDKYWMRVLWKAGLTHDLGQGRSADFDLSAELRNFAKEKGIPFRAQLMVEQLQSEGIKVDQAKLAGLYLEFFTRIKKAGYDVTKYGEERILRICRAFFHDSFSRQILEDRASEFPLRIEDEVKWIVCYHTYPEMLPADAGYMVRTLTEILKSADSLDARNAVSRGKIYGRPGDFKPSLEDAEDYLLKEYRAGHISQRVMEAVFSVIHGDSNEFRRMIMRAREQPEGSPWPDYDQQYRRKSLEEIVNRSGRNRDVSQGAGPQLGIEEKPQSSI